ncbi:MAG TPA: response regulator transcription factor [Polyangiaceae bacterium]|jgi:DNA-binding NarL/FixJ family response regulator|nr:response regulator transcription factor [Polyangiaceae bacterium]
MVSGTQSPVEGLEQSVTTNSPEFLVVEDHPMVMRTLRTYLQRVGTVLEAGTVQEGLRMFEEHTNLAGMLVDVNLPDGLGTDLIREIRRRDPVLPILMLTGSDERGWANEAHALGVEFVFKPIVTESLERFSARAVARASSGDDSLAAVVSELVSSHGLSPREVQVLTLSLSGTPRVALTDEMGVSDNTVKTTVRHLLRKTTADTLDDLVQYVMRAALQRRSAPNNTADSLAARSGSSRPPARRAH